MKILISSDENNKKFILKAIDFNFSKLRGVQVFIKSINNGSLLNDTIEIYFADSDIKHIYAKIKELFVNRFGCILVRDEVSDTIIEEAENEAKRFESFSKRAYEIRNNNIDREELETFMGVLNKDVFKRELRPFQLLAAYHIAFSENACNFSVPGSGKTSTVLAAYELLKQTGKVNKLLVIGPLAAFIAWQKEYKKCYDKEPTLLEIRGGVKEKNIRSRLERTHIREELIIVNYESVDGKLDILKKFLKNNKAMVVLDEAHRIKNVEEGVRSRATLALSTYAKSRVILTGTPASNSYVDLYNLYKFIWPANNVVGYSVMQLADMSKNDNDPRVSDLMNRIAPFFIRVKKGDLDLPDAIFNKPDIIEMSGAQKIIYKAIEEMAVRKFENTALSEVFRKSAFIRLRQAASNPRLLSKPLQDSMMFDEDEEIALSSLDDAIDVDDNILELIKNYDETPCKFEAANILSQKIIKDGGKLLIWCEFVDTCNGLSDYLSSKGIKNAILYGKTLPDDRKRIIDDFHDNPSLSVVIANPHAVGESISLHEACHNALYLEQGYNAGVYMQSKDRIHRVGLSDDVVTNYYYFHAAETIDNLAYDKVMLKERRMLNLIESEEIPLLSRNKDFMEDMEDEIKSIIRAYYERKKQGI